MPEPSDQRLSFNKVANLYDQIRPSYPAELFDDLFDLLPNRPTIVEVGPGTGQATKDLLQRGAAVRAVEIGPALASSLRSNFDSSRLEIVVGDFERVPTESEGCDALFSATAYHWVSQGAQTDRPANLLRPGGVIAIVDLIQVSSPDDAGFFEAVQPIYDRYGLSHVGSPAPTRANVDPTIREVLASDARFVNVVVRTYDWNQIYTAAEYRLLMLTYSGTQAMGETERTSLLDDIESFIDENFDGQVTRPIVITLTSASLKK